MKKVRSSELNFFEQSYAFCSPHNNLAQNMRNTTINSNTLKPKSQLIPTSLKSLFLMVSISLLTLFQTGCTSNPPTPPQIIEQDPKESIYQLALLDLKTKQQRAMVTVIPGHLDGRNNPTMTQSLHQPNLALLINAAEQEHAEAQWLLGMLYGFSEKHQERLKRETAHQDTLFTAAVFDSQVQENLTKSIRWLEASLNNGKTEAAYWLGLLYLIDEESDEMPEHLVATIEQRALQGDILCQALMAQFHADGIFVEQDQLASLKWLRQAAQGGNASAQNTLGIKHMSGEWVDRDTATGAYWFRKSAEAGYATGQFNYGSCLEHGIGIKPDFFNALIWYQMSAIQKNNKAIHRLVEIYQDGIGLDEQPVIAAEWLVVGAMNADPQLQTKLGRFYQKGTGLNKNPKSGIYWYKQAALQGYLPAIHLLALSYLEGIGVTSNQETAITLLKTAAEHDYAESQFLLGTLLIATDPNPSEENTQASIYWLRQAAHQGHSKAQKILDYLDSGI